MTDDYHSLDQLNISDPAELYCDLLMASADNGQASEQHFRTVLESMALVGVMVDTEGTLLMCNQYLLTLTGWQRHEIIGGNWFERFVPPEQRQEIQARLRASNQSRDRRLPLGSAHQRFIHHEHEIVTRRGDRRLIAWYSVLLHSPQGTLCGMTSLGLNITEHSLAWSRSRDSQMRFQGLGTKPLWGTLRYVLYPSGAEVITAIDPTCADLWGLAPEQAIADPQRLWQIIHSDDREAVRHLIRHSAATLTPWFCEWRILPPSGRQRWLQGVGQPEQRNQGQVIWETVLLDITDRKQAEQALANANQQMQTFIDNIPSLVNLFTPSGHYLQVNQAAAAGFGLTPKDLVGRAFSDLLPPAVVQRFMTRIDRLVTTQQPLTVEDNLDFNRQQRVFRSVLFPVTFEAGQVTVIGSIATDITALVEAQATLHRQAEEERLIRTMTQHIRQSLNLQSILQTTVSEVRQFLQTDRVLIYRFNPDWSGDMIVEAVMPPWRVALGTTIKDPCFSDRLIQQYLNGYVGFIEDVERADLSPCYRSLLRSFQVQANLTLAIKNSDNQLWGLLCVHHCRSPRHWQQREIVLLTQLCDQVAIALQQSQLLEQAATRAQQEQLLNNIIGAISGSLELETVLQRATDEILHTFQASRSLVILCHETDTELRHTTTAAVPGCNNFQDEVIPIQGNPHAQAVLQGVDPVAITDVTQSPLMAPVLPLVKKLDIGAILAVSIRYQGQVVGILSVHQCPHPRPWSDSEIRLIKRVADHLAIAIHQAELYTQARTELAERKRLEAQLRYDASHDRLTGLPNRVLFVERLSQALAEIQDQKTVSGSKVDHHLSFAVLFLDLDRFKVINDSLGHAMGDQLLQVVAQRLRLCLQPGDIAARLGGDEFVVLLTRLSDITMATTMACRIHTMLETPVLLAGHEVFIHASIGIALGSSTYTDPNQLLRDADIAMYKAKGSNREYAIFDAPMHTLVMQQMEIENDLRRALERDELRLFYQPIINLATGQLQGFEALVRWQHPRRGLVPPNDFISIAENTGLITTLDLWTLNEACRQLAEWRRQLPANHPLTVSVNLSGQQFVRPDLIQQIDQALSNNGLQGQHLKVEITESVLIQNAQLAIDLLHQLRRRRIQICMDDFGTGYSSLSYLHRFPIDVLKIDKSFITNLHSPNPNPGDYEIVKAIINLATSLQLTVVAEGIETNDQRQYLQTHHCQGGQGYLFARPLPVAEATALIISPNAELTP
jgi:diguanylate cyclase (GGDEF)-like protein/PAS domain S-box-containing protein